MWFFIPIFFNNFPFDVGCFDILKFYCQVVGIFIAERPHGQKQPRKQVPGNRHFEIHNHNFAQFRCVQKYEPLSQIEW